MALNGPPGRHGLAPAVNRGPRRLAKRLFDIIASLIGLAVFGLPLLALALWIKLDSKGPIFYRGQRGGRFGKPFGIFKFRTMVLDADKIGGLSTSDHDPRITRAGRFLRKGKLDELPQLINVLAGDMSVVGPRPEVLKYVDMYVGEEKEILQVRPGISDWASIWNADEGAVLAGSDDPDRAYEELIRPTKLKLQLDYARNHSLWIDIRIILSTIRKVLQKDWLPRRLAPYGRLQDHQVRTDGPEGEGSAPLA